MDDIIYEQDYRRSSSLSEEDKRALAIFDRAMFGSFAKDYTAAMDAIPKVVVPEDKENFDFLLARCDEMAKIKHWKVRGVVDYHKWFSYIDVIMPLAEFDDADSLDLLREIAARATTVSFYSQENGNVKLHIMINYFRELMTDEHHGYLTFDAIMKDEKLAEMLGIQPLPPEMEAAAKEMADILDRFEAETKFDRTTVFKAILARMSEESEENQTLERMNELAAQLLETALNETDEYEDNGGK